MLFEARGKTKREIEQLVARRSPRPDVPASIVPQPLELDTSADTMAGAHAEIRPGADRPGEPPEASPLATSTIKPLSVERWAVQFTASTDFRETLERCFELLSHVFPRATNGGSARRRQHARRDETDLPALLDRALDAPRRAQRESGAQRLWC